MIKKLLGLVVFIFFINTNMHSQCAAITGTACTDPAPIVINNSITCPTPANANGRRNYEVSNMIAGATYRVSNCGSGLDTQMTIRDTGGISVGYNDDNGPACFGTAASIDFIPPANGTYRIQVNKYNCLGGAGASNSSNGDIVVTLLSNAPAPVTNDLCANATALPCGTTNLAGTTIGTTNIPNSTGCFLSNYGVWYTFTGDGDQTTIDVSGTGGFDIEVAIESGSCGAFTNLNCEDSGNPESYTFNTVNGIDYYVYVAYWTTGSTTGDFTISRSCTTAPPDPCDNATPLPCATTGLAGTTVGSTAYTSTIGCALSDYGTWYTFTGDGQQTTISSDAAAGFDHEMAIASGSCGVFTNITCQDSGFSGGIETYTFTSTVGVDYYVYIAHYSDTSTTTGNFTITRTCTPAPTPPVNDQVCNATILTPNGTCIPTSGTLEGATNSNIDSCFGTPDNDVWYSFEATYTSHTVNISNFAGSDTDMYHAVYGPFTPPDCNVTTSENLTCEDFNDYTDLTGLTIGAIYYVQVFTYSGGIETTTFDICVTEPCTNSDPINNVPTVCPLIAGELGIDPFVDPFDPDPSFSLDCSNPNLTLEAHSTIRTTDSYIVEQINYPFPNFTPTGFSTPQVIGTDDVWADDWTVLPFNFCFYGTTYTQALVGANGMITFDSANVEGTSCGYAFSDNLPSTAGALFNETIYGVYHDIDPTGVSNPTESWVEGSPGCRRFVTVWRGVPMFGDATVSREYTGMVVLHETTNIIEVFIENKRLENGNVNPWNDGNAIVGLQGNANAGEAITAPCRNGLDDNWEATNEAWRFVPNGNVITPDLVEWFSASTGSTVIGTGSTLPITTPDTYTAEVTYTTCASPFPVTFSDDVVVDQSAKIWTGALNTNWYEDANWVPAAVPTPADCVLIPDTSTGSNRYPIADVSNRPIPLPPPSAYALNLTVDVGASIEVLADTELVVTDWVNLNGTIDIRSTGSLIQINDGAVNANNNLGTGSINMERTVSGISSYDYIYWSTPVESFGVGGVSPGSTHIYEWDPNIPANGVGGYGDWLPTSEIMQNGKGYIIRNIVGTPTPLTPVFSGKPNNGIITKAITRGTYNVASPGGDYPGPGGTLATRLDDNWNLVGNPYPSAISATDFIVRNASVISDDSTPVTSGAIYLWRHLAAPSNTEADPFYGDFVYNYNPNDYVVYNASGPNPAGQFGGDIAAGQAFFVLMEHSAPRNTSVVRFDNAMRNETLDNSDFIRTEESETRRIINAEKHRIWLDLITPSNTANSILVGYIDGATDEEDRMFDAHELSETSTRFYSLVENKPLSIQGKALPFEDTDTVSLGIDIPENGNYKIAINTIDGLFLDTNQAIFLEDTYNEIIHDLRVNPYSFNTEVGIYDDRFILRYNGESLDIDEFNLNSGLEIIAPNNHYIKVKSENSAIDSIYIYDLLGRVLVKQNGINAFEFNINNFNYSEGVYVVKAILLDGKQKIQKVILKH